MCKDELRNWLQQVASGEPIALAAALSELNSDGDGEQYAQNLRTLSSEFYVCCAAIARLMQWWGIHRKNEEV